MRNRYRYNIPALVAFFEADKSRGAYTRAAAKFKIPVCAIYQKMRYLRDIAAMKKLMENTDDTSKASG